MHLLLELQPFFYGFIEIGDNFAGYALCPACSQTATIIDIARNLVLSGELFMPAAH